MTAFNVILAAVKTKLEQAPAVSTQVYRARLKPVAAQHNDAVVIRIQGGSAERFAILGGPTDWDTTIDIECYARSATLSPDEAVDALLGKVWARLAADTTLGGLVMLLHQSDLSYDFSGAADDMACATLTLKVMHRTNNPLME